MVEYILHNSHATEQAAKHSRKMYVSTPYNRVQAVEEKLKKIFNDEINSDWSILLSYKPEVISIRVRNELPTCYYITPFLTASSIRIVRNYLQ